MTPGVFVTGSEPASGKSAVALGVQQLLARRIGRLGVFRPVVAHPEHDPILDLLRPNGADFVPYAASYGVGYADVRADEERALEQIVARYRALAAQCDGVLAVGTDFANLGTTGELAFNARVAINIGLPALCVVSGHERSARETCDAISGALARLKSAGCEVVAVIANRVHDDCLEDIKLEAGVPIWAVPEVELLMAPTVGQIASAVGGEMIAGDPELLEREALQIVVAAMTLPNLMERITEGSLLITPGDRAEVLLAALFAHASSVLPSPAGVAADRRPEAAGRVPAPTRGLLDDAADHPHRQGHVHDGFAGGSARGRDRAGHAAQDHEVAGAVRGARGRRRTCSTASRSRAARR